MKKIFRRLAAGAIVGAMLCTSAGAVQANVATTVKEATETSGKFTVSSKDAGLTLTDGNQYVLLVAKGTYTAGANTLDVTIDESTLTYIDQAAAVNGAVSFDFIPSTKVNSVILLGGEFGNGVQSPVVIGYITAKGVTVSVNIQLSGISSTKTDNITISLKGTAEGSSMDTDNSFFLPETANGTYDVIIRKPGFLNAGAQVTISSGNASINGTVELFGGDVDWNNEINAYDLAGFLSCWSGNIQEGYYPDFDESGDITAFDLSNLISNFGKRGQ